jgi:biopolymer transport protein ExbD
MIESQWRAVLLCLALGLMGCGRGEPAEMAASKPAPIVLTTQQATGQKPATQPQTARDPAPAAPAVLTVRASGALFDLDGKPVASPDDAEEALKKERAPLQQPRTVFRAERQTDIFRIATALALYRKAGFREVELQEAANPNRKGPILTLADSKTADEPAGPAAEKAARMIVIVHANGSGSQAGDVRDVSFKTAAGETGLGRGKWRAGLPKAIAGVAASFDDKDVCEIQADPKLSYGAVLEVIEVCSAAGLKHIELSILAGKRADE